MSSRVIGRTTADSTYVLDNVLLFLNKLDEDLLLGLNRHIVKFVFQLLLLYSYGKVDDLSRLRSGSTCVDTR